MLTRRHIRVKVAQSIYAFHNQEHADLQKQEKFLLYSMEQMHDLYLLLLDVLVAVQDQAAIYMEKSKGKHLPTEADKNPVRKFVDNRAIHLLADHKELQQLLKQRKLNNWKEDNEYVQILFKELRESSLYTNYLQSSDSSFYEDRDFLIAAYKEIIAPNEKLYDYLEDKRLTWLDDFPIVNTAIVRMLSQLKPTNEAKTVVTKLYKSDDDRDFAIALFRKTLLQEEKLNALIEGKTPNWDKDRIADLDLMLIKMGIVEFLEFPSIPVKVTINEYLEIAKEYSTPKSSIFINGILDKLVKEFQDANKLNKIGRGLQ